MVTVPAPEVLSKKDLLEPRENLRLPAASMTTLEGEASVPGSRPLEPPWPSWRVPEATWVPPAQVAAGLSRMRVEPPNLVSEPTPEMLPPEKVCSHAPVSSEPPPGPRMRLRVKV